MAAEGPGIEEIFMSAQFEYNVPDCRSCGGIPWLTSLTPDLENVAVELGLSEESRWLSRT
jgi:hypothetical protein